jgi:membrane protein YqaA with SNARE-associated domain
MVGIGCLVGSVFIYVIGTAISLVHARIHQAMEDQQNDDQSKHIL